MAKVIITLWDDVDPNSNEVHADASFDPPVKNIEELDSPAQRMALTMLSSQIQSGDSIEPTYAEEDADHE